MATKPDTQVLGEASTLSPTARASQEFERRNAIEFYGCVEREGSLTDRAFMLRLTSFRPYDEHTRGLVKSVVDEGPVGAFVQHLLHTPQPIPKSIMTPPRLPRPKKSKSIRPAKSLLELLLSEDDKAA
ncbi:hypothetical protein ASG60_20675 [Methylobacterium sp. Leaf469]|uniref:hypothetical protein n=1 Tax=Methylobacterium sp. Leaf469 TaxID=1736387 RepID=UPI0006F96CB4|nr:hypothetical protein [Methylobacterium sp. Leaf469]KQT96095.1 hypothetical protein ASG60_20675 [Methylobacterium sp. Leaf469]